VERKEADGKGVEMDGEDEEEEEEKEKDEGFDLFSGDMFKKRSGFAEMLRFSRERSYNWGKQIKTIPHKKK
jgi:hypothetical protein